MTKTFIGTKVMQAETAERDGVLGYRVIYPDGYESWSPPEAFEEAYRLSGEMNFGHALEMLKRGKAVARSGWNGKGMFLYHVPANAYLPTTEIGAAIARDPAIADRHQGRVPYGAYIAMKTAQGNVVPWLASQTDVLADDWSVVEMEGNLNG